MNHISVINENNKMQNISRIGGLGGLSGISQPTKGELAGATTASQTTLMSQDKSESRQADGKKLNYISINSQTEGLGIGQSRGTGREGFSSQNSMDLSPSIQYSRQALLKLKESSQSPKNFPTNSRDQSPETVRQIEGLNLTNQAKRNEQKLLKNKLNQRNQHMITKRKLPSIL